MGSRYNSVLLGFSLWTLLFLGLDRDLLACVTFSLALCFKQMGLYYAPRGRMLLAREMLMAGRFRWVRACL